MAEKAYQIGTHRLQQSSFGGNFEKADKGHQQLMSLHHPNQIDKQGLLENSCVTFQYYNSSKFASNSTNKEQLANQQNAQNYFYMTKTTNQTNQDSNTSKEHETETKAPVI